MMGEVLPGGSEEVNRRLELHRHLDVWVQEQEAQGVPCEPVEVAFGRALADRLTPNVVPMGYVMVTELLIADCQSGQSGYPDKPLVWEITGYPDQMYAVLRMTADALAGAAFGEDYGKQVGEIRDSIAHGLAGGSPGSN
ncbi:MAG: hypothetical protein ACREGD_00255 [Candidatus Saccharimonadales bacterium]